MIWQTRRPQAQRRLQYRAGLSFVMSWLAASTWIEPPLSTGRASAMMMFGAG
jgi:hypothetical protein